MAIPTRLEVLLHSRKSAAAGPVDEISGSAVNAPRRSALVDRFVAMARVI